MAAVPCSTRYVGVCGSSVSFGGGLVACRIIGISSGGGGVVMEVCGVFVHSGRLVVAIGSSAVRGRGAVVSFPETMCR
ncbi:hypothetical protein [Mycolicibacterium sp. GF69]|uniref:hypothetical protein n=1 Tax=Mycolicibacterium sp. GF69 TaxID=2267251 RepID=UPI0010583117|nr:hypothetical protein [Mycolicibacterium sp. GF69]